MVKNESARQLIEEKNALIIKLDKPYDDSIKKETDLERVSYLEKAILSSAKEHLENTMNDFKQKDIPQNKQLTIKDLRKMMREKYGIYKQVALETRELYARVVEKKKEGKAIEELMRQGKEEDWQEIKERAMRY